MVMVFHLGLVLPLRVLITWLKLHLVTALLGWFLIGVLLMGMIRLLFLAVSRITPNVWTDGSLVLDEVAGISFFADRAASFWDARSWGQVDLIHPVGNFPSCRGFCSVPVPFQSVQRAELWGVSHFGFTVSWCCSFGCGQSWCCSCRSSAGWSSWFHSFLSFIRMVTFFYLLTGCFVFVVLTR